MKEKMELDVECIHNWRSPHIDPRTGKTKREQEIKFKDKDTGKVYLWEAPGNSQQITDKACKFQVGKKYRISFHVEEGCTRITYVNKLKEY